MSHPIAKNCHDTPTHTVAIGENFDFLAKLSREASSFDVIYIDPPYNTGNKLSYHDRRSSDGWADFMSQRLTLARQLMKDDAVIFISIDDSSLCSLRAVCDAIFGKQNFLGMFITKQAVRSNSKYINTIHEYVVTYAKRSKEVDNFYIKRINDPSDSLMIKDISRKVRKEFKITGRVGAEKLLAKLNAEYMTTKGMTWLRNYSTVDERGNIFFPKDLSVPGTPAELMIDEIGLHLPALKTRRWSSAKKMIQLYHDNKLYFKGSRPYEKHYLMDAIDHVSSILDFYSRQGTNDLNKLGLRGLFDTPKPVELIKYLIRIATNQKNEARILDFFAGSGTTGQAVMEINREDAKKHSFYLVQLDEDIAQDSDQYQFALNHNLSPTVDQLMMYRLATAKKRLGCDADIKVIQKD